MNVELPKRDSLETLLAKERRQSQAVEEAGEISDEAAMPELEKLWDIEKAILTAPVRTPDDAARKIEWALGQKICGEEYHGPLKGLDTNMFSGIVHALKGHKRDLSAKCTTVDLTKLSAADLNRLVLHMVPLANSEHSEALSELASDLALDAEAELSARPTESVETALHQLLLLGDAASQIDPDTAAVVLPKAYAVLGIERWKERYDYSLGKAKTETNHDTSIQGNR